MGLPVARFLEEAKTQLEGTNLLWILSSIRLPVEADGNLKVENLKTLFRAAIKQAPEPVNGKCQKMLDFLNTY